MWRWMQPSGVVVFLARAEEVRCFLPHGPQACGKEESIHGGIVVLPSAMLRREVPEKWFR